MKRQDIKIPIMIRVKMQALRNKRKDIDERMEGLKNGNTGFKSLLMVLSEMQVWMDDVKDLEQEIIKLKDGV